MNERTTCPIQSLPFTASAAIPLQVQVQGNLVDLWLAEFDEDAAHLQWLQETLSGDEQTRAAQFRFSQSRLEFIFARGTLRVLLAQYLNVAPTRLQFGYEETGKPYLMTETETRIPLRFNLTHTNGLVVYAMAWNCELGIDVEQIRAELVDEPTAQQFLTPGEFSVWQRLPSALQPTAFFHSWTCKEAYLKAIGTGLSVAPETIKVELGKDAIPRWSEIPSSQATGTFYHFVPKTGYVGALVVLEKPVVFQI